MKTDTLLSAERRCTNLETCDESILDESEKELLALWYEMKRMKISGTVGDTPRTEEHIKAENDSGHWADMDVCDPDFARQLEREINTMREKIRQLREKAMTKECALEESVEIIADYKRENAALKEAIKRAMKIWEDDPRTPFGGIYDTLRQALAATQRSDTP